MRSNNHRRGKGGRNASRKKQSSSEDDVGQYPARFAANAAIVHWRNPKVIDPFPQRYRTVMTIAFEGYIAAGTGPALYYIRGNSVWIPASGGGFTNILPAIATTQPTGYSNLVNATFFQAWRVHGSRIVYQIAPEAAVDTCNLTITPSFLVTQPASVQLALSQQFTKSKMVSESQPEGSQTIVNKITTARLFGVRPQAIEDDLSGQFYGTVAGAPANPWYWVINYAPSNVAVSVNKTPFKFKVEYDIELFADSTADNLETMRARKATPLEVFEATPCTAAELLRAYRANPTPEGMKAYVKQLALESP